MGRGHLGKPGSEEEWRSGELSHSRRGNADLINRVEDGYMGAREKGSAKWGRTLLQPCLDQVRYKKGIIYQLSWLLLCELDTGLSYLGRGTSTEKMLLTDCLLGSL